MPFLLQNFASNTVNYFDAQIIPWPISNFAFTDTRGVTNPLSIVGYIYLRVRGESARLNIPERGLYDGEKNFIYLTIDLPRDFD